MATLDLTGTGASAVPATKRHVRELARTLRREEREEISASGGFNDPEPGIRMSLNRSREAWAIYAGGDLLCIVGVHVQREADVVWCMSSEKVEQHKLTYWRASKKIVEQLRSRHAYMTNMIHCKYHRAVSWATRLGFKASPPEKYGARGELFVRMSIGTQKLVTHV